MLKINFSGNLTLQKIIYCYIINNILMTALTQKGTGIHSPTLDSIKMVENFIRDNSGEYKKTALCNELPKKMMYQTFMQIIDYLLESGKIAADSEGHICWIYNPEVLKYYKNHEELRIK